MNELAEAYGVPDELMAFVRSGFLMVAREDKDRATVEFDVPSMNWTGSSDRYKFHVLVWIRPDRNADFCHFYADKPGDLPNFYVRIDTDHSRDEQVEGLESVEELIDWLSGRHQE